MVDPASYSFPYSQGHQIATFSEARDALCNFTIPDRYTVEAELDEILGEPHPEEAFAARLALYHLHLETGYLRDKLAEKCRFTRMMLTIPQTAADLVKLLESGGRLLRAIQTPMPAEMFIESMVILFGLAAVPVSIRFLNKNFVETGLLSPSPLNGTAPPFRAKHVFWKHLSNARAAMNRFGPKVVVFEDFIRSAAMYLRLLQQTCSLRTNTQTLNMKNKRDVTFVVVLHEITKATEHTKNTFQRLDRFAGKFLHGARLGYLSPATNTEFEADLERVERDVRALETALRKLEDQIVRLQSTGFGQDPCAGPREPFALAFRRSASPPRRRPVENANPAAVTPAAMLVDREPHPAMRSDPAATPSASSKRDKVKTKAHPSARRTSLESTARASIASGPTPTPERRVIWGYDDNLWDAVEQQIERAFGKRHWLEEKAVRVGEKAGVGIWSRVPTERLPPPLRKPDGLVGHRTVGHSHTLSMFFSESRVFTRGKAQYCILGIGFHVGKTNKKYNALWSSEERGVFWRTIQL